VEHVLIGGYDSCLPTNKAECQNTEGKEYFMQNYW